MKIETIEEEEEKKEQPVVVVEEEEKKGLVPIGNGYEFSNYKWTQNAKDVSINIPIFSPNIISITINGQIFLEGELFSIIKSENSMWLIDSDNKKRELIVELDKKKFDEWWPCVLKGDTEIDLSKVRPPNANISDLDQETRATIGKMMFEQEEKEKNGFYKDKM